MALNGVSGGFANPFLGVAIQGPVVFERVPDVPLPAALPLFAIGLAALGLFGWRRKRKAALAA